MGRFIERGAIYILVVGAPQVIIWSKTAENANKMELGGGGIFPLAWLTLIHALGVLLLVYLYFSGSCFSLSLIPISVCPPGKSQLFSHGLHPWHSRAGCVSHLGHTNPDLDWRWRGWNQRVRGFFFFCFFCLCASPSERWVHPEKHPVTFLPLIPEGLHWVWAWTRVIGSGLIE